jgi:hypothetical protein
MGKRSMRKELQRQFKRIMKQKKKSGITKELPKGNNDYKKIT